MEAAAGSKGFLSDIGKVRVLLIAWWQQVIGSA